jgi:hypothetical protein
MLTEAYALRHLTAYLGAPHLEQLTHRRDAGSQLLVHWGCGCTAMGAPGLNDETTELRWSRCDHHGAESAVR